VSCVLSIALPSGTIEPARTKSGILSIGALAWMVWPPSYCHRSSESVVF